MKKKRIFSIQLTIMCMLFLCSSCRSIEDDWQEAQKVDTAKKYLEFVKKYPDTDYAAAASARIKFLQEDFQPKDRKKTERKSSISHFKYNTSEANKAWEDACSSNTFEAYARFHRNFLTARPDELREKLLNLAATTNQTAGESYLTDHLAQLAASDKFAGHHVTVKFKASLLHLIDGVALQYSRGIYFMTNPPLSSLSFGPELIYLFLPDTGQRLIFESDTNGLHYISGTGIVLVSGKDFSVYIYQKGKKKDE